MLNGLEAAVSRAMWLPRYRTMRYEAPARLA